MQVLNIFDIGNTGGVKMKKVLVTGAKGMLGVDVCRIFSEKFRVFPTDVEELDIRDYHKVLETTKEINPDIIVHLAAMTDVDACEREPDLAYRTNAVGTQNMVLAANECEAVLVYLSTGSIYGGDKEYPYTEYDEPAPKSVYSRSKLEGERWVLNTARQFYIVTAGWMFGGGVLDKKFVRKIMELSDTKKELKVVNDKFGSPTYTVDLSAGILELLEWGRYGKYHMANNGYCNRYELAKKILDITGNKDCKLIPVSSEEFPLAAPRPRMEAIYNYNLMLLKNEIMRHWEEALEEYIKRIKLEEKKLQDVQKT
jgi:dTDP-4-dehydrorhamnose reductase